MASLQDLSKCSASRGASNIILCLECYSVPRAGRKMKRNDQVTYPLLNQQLGECFGNQIFHNGWIDYRDAFHAVLQL